MPDRRCRKLSAVRSPVRIEPKGPTTMAATSPASTRVPSGKSAAYSQGGCTISKTQAAASAPLSTPALLATIWASPISCVSTTRRVVTSPAPRSSLRAMPTTCSSSGFDETIRLLAQAERLLCETEEVRALAAHAAVLPRLFDDSAIDDLAPEVPAVDREPEHGLVDVLQL